MRRGPLTPTHSFKGSPKVSPKASSKVTITDVEPTAAELPPANASEVTSQHDSHSLLSSPIDQNARGSPEGAPALPQPRADKTME